MFAAIDAFLLFFSYEMAVLPMYLLIAIWGSTRKDYSAMKLTLFLFAGSAILIVVLVLTYWAVGARHLRHARMGRALLRRGVPEVGLPADR